LGDPSWVFVDPLEELAVTLGTLEIEPVQDWEWEEAKTRDLLHRHRKRAGSMFL